MTPLDIMGRLPGTILIATRNPGKIKEIRDLVREAPVVFLSLADVDDAPEVIEDGDSFEANALKKAREVAKKTDMVTLADDSGLCIEALGGRPGVQSARYAGDGASDEEKCSRILAEMSHVPDEDRSATFVCVLALVSPRGEEHLFRGECEGRITREPRGDAGFGYDPIFYFEQAGCTFAEMDRQSKNRVSHRGRALDAFADYLRALLSSD